MNPIQVKIFIDQILGMPPHIAAQQLQANVQHFGNTFFQVLQLMIQDERKSSQYEPTTNMPGYIFESILEDRSRASQRMQYLQLIYDHHLTSLINQDYDLL
jgi:G:T/U-mismatch repair DNA glycosylase